MLPRRLLAFGSLALALAMSARADDVTLITGSTVKGAVGGHFRGDVQSESPKEVTIKLGANSQTVPLDQIASITYTGQPREMALAESKESAGALAEAAELYKKSAAEASEKPFVQQTALFHQADTTAQLAMADPSKVAEATALLSTFVKTYPTSRHIVSALENLARLQLNKGDVAGVEKTIAEMTKQPQSAERAAVLRAKVFGKQGNHAKAIAELDALIKAAAEGSTQRREAQLAKAESLAALKKYPEAETAVRTVIKTLPAEDAQGQSAAYNTLGDCLSAAGKPKDALQAYYHTDVLYSKDKEQHPRALAHIALLWRSLNQVPRADETVARLRQEYPSSPWLTVAQGGAASAGK